MLKIKVVKSLIDLKTNKSEFPQIMITPIRFENDPVTGFYIKCPFCNKISTFQYLVMESSIINCKVEHCKILVDVNEIKDKIESYETKEEFYD